MSRNNDPKPSHTPLSSDRRLETGFLREKHLLEIVPISHATLWRRVKEKTFPAPIKLSERVTVWRVEEILAWMNEMAARRRPA